MEQFITLIVGLGGALMGSGLIQFFVNRHDNKIEKKIDKILDEQNKAEKDQLRTQLLVMMSLMPNNTQEILTLAERYFGDLKGDWFYSSLFAKWLKDNNIEKPIWFEKE